ncbi:MAG: type II secretion system protein [Candidatus Paceibacterota bacterium]|jgi:prepilin-type N-terminal cleavage/methylation domain-containing protein
MLNKDKQLRVIENKCKMRIRAGFTLVEMLVAIAVFMIVMTVAVGSLVSIVDANRKSQAIKTVINNVNLAIESISKNMRIGTRYYCNDISGWTNSSNVCNSGQEEIKYLSSDGRTVVLYKYVATTPELISSGEGNIQRCSITTTEDISQITDSDCINNWQSLTAPTPVLDITSMKFYVLGAERNDKIQPRVLITIEGVAGTKEATKATFSLQTTVSQRAREF